MYTSISWNLQLSVREGQLSALRDLMNEMVEATKEEDGTLIYEWSMSDDGVLRLEA